MSAIFQPTQQRNSAQLELFGSTAPAPPTVPSPHPCVRCGSATATLESSRGPHAGELRCKDCGHHVMWASHDLAAKIRGMGEAISWYASGLSSAVPW
jgi:hypothetical protein